MLQQPPIINIVSGSFPRTARLLSAADFNGVFKSRNKRFANRYWTILVTQNHGEQPAKARLGMAIAKKRAKRAVDRNRLKRHVRESFRCHRLLLGNIDVVVMNRDSAAVATPAELHKSLDQLWTQIAKDKISLR